MHIDHTRTATAKDRTVTRRTARRMRIAHNMAVLLGVIAFGDDAPMSPAAR